MVWTPIRLPVFNGNVTVTGLTRTRQLGITMKIDIDAMSYDELMALNRKIVERLKFLDAMHTHKEMMQFSPGDEVVFDHPGRGKQFGTLVKYNKKTVTVITESGQRWNVSPHLLRKVKDIKSQKKSTRKVIDLPKK